MPAPYTLKIDKEGLPVEDSILTIRLHRTPLGITYVQGCHEGETSWHDIVVLGPDTVYLPRILGSTYTWKQVMLDG